MKGQTALGVSKRLTWSNRAVESIATRMLLGLNKGRYSALQEKHFDDFCKNYSKIIEEFIPLVPRAMSAATAAIVKCAIKYEKAKAKEFAYKIKHGMFNGKTDPAWHFYKWMKGVRRGGDKFKTQEDIYALALTACRAFCQNRTLTELNPATKDILVFNNELQIWE